MHYLPYALCAIVVLAIALLAGCRDQDNIDDCSRRGKPQRKTADGWTCNMVAPIPLDR